MKFTPPLRSAILIQRYKRFLADVIKPDGKQTTLHCANTGAMTGCATPGDTVWYSTSDNPKRKYPSSWELTQTLAGHWICVNTLQANRLAHEAITQGIITELSGYQQIRSEVRYGTENSRIDLLLQAEGTADCYVEVKSVTLLADKGNGFFPDAVTLRGQKHLRELQQQAKRGYRAVLFFVVLHSGIQQVAPAAHIDPQYATMLADAVAQGVEIICYHSTIHPTKLAITQTCPFILSIEN